jgi:hypothetical protein
LDCFVVTDHYHFKVTAVFERDLELFATPIVQYKIIKAGLSRWEQQRVSSFFQVQRSLGSDITSRNGLRRIHDNYIAVSLISTVAFRHP